MHRTFVISDIWFNRNCKDDDMNITDINNVKISAWNNTVSDNDDVYVLGGFGISDLYNIIVRLKGRIHFLDNFFNDDERRFIEDMKSNNVIEKFDNIEFNRHAIMAYNKNNGKATIKISTTLGYYYKTNRTDKKSYENIKKQTRYTSEFVYVYDERKFTKNQVTFSVLCPNCGAPLRGLESKFCEYCGNHVEKINLKIWKMSSYKEDY